MPKVEDTQDLRSHESYNKLGYASPSKLTGLCVSSDAEAASNQKNVTRSPIASFDVNDIAAQQSN